MKTPYLGVHQTGSRPNYGSRKEFNFGEATRWIRDALSQEGIQIALEPIGYVIRGAQFGGARLDAEVGLSAERIGYGFLDGLLDRAMSVGVQITEETERDITKWFGL